MKSIKIPDDIQIHDSRILFLPKFKVSFEDPLAQTAFELEPRRLESFLCCKTEPRGRDDEGRGLLRVCDRRSGHLGSCVGEIEVVKEEEEE